MYLVRTTYVSRAHDMQLLGKPPIISCAWDIYRAHANIMSCARDTGACSFRYSILNQVEQGTCNLNSLVQLLTCSFLGKPPIISCAWDICRAHTNYVVCTRYMSCAWDICHEHKNNFFGVACSFRYSILNQVEQGTCNLNSLVQLLTCSFLGKPPIISCAWDITCTHKNYVVCTRYMSCAWDICHEHKIRFFWGWRVPLGTPY